MESSCNRQHGRIASGGWLAFGMLGLLVFCDAAAAATLSVKQEGLEIDAGPMGTFSLA